MCSLGARGSRRSFLSLRICSSSPGLLVWSWTPSWSPFSAPSRCLRLPYTLPRGRASRLCTGSSWSASPVGSASLDPSDRASPGLPSARRHLRATALGCHVLQAPPVRVPVLGTQPGRPRTAEPRGRQPCTVWVPRSTPASEQVPCSPGACNVLSAGDSDESRGRGHADAAQDAQDVAGGGSPSGGSRLRPPPAWQSGGHERFQIRGLT